MRAAAVLLRRAVVGCGRFEDDDDDDDDDERLGVDACGITGGE